MTKLVNKIKNPFYYTSLLFILFFASFFFVENVAFLDRASLPKNIYIIKSLTPFFLLSILFTIYLLLQKIILKSNISFRTVFILALIINSTVLFIPPKTSVDYYTYLASFRLISQHHDNPYLTPYAKYKQDPLYDNLKTSWSNHKQVYGPLFFYVGSVFTFLSGDNLFLNIFLFKTLLIFINLITIFLIYVTTKSTIATFLYAFNPLIIFDLLINGHNDIFTIFFLIISFYFLNKNRHLLSWIFFVASFYFKFTSVIIAPFFWLLLIYKNKKANRLKFIFYSILAFFLITIISYFPLWKGWKIFTPYHEFLGIKSFLFTSIFITTLTSIARIASLGIWQYSEIYDWVLKISKIFFLILYGFISLKFYLMKKWDIVLYANIILGIFFSISFAWLMPWYLINLLFFLVLGYTKKREKIYLYLINLVSLYGIFFYVLLR